MSKSITIQDKDYLQWVKELGSRYRRSQIKAAVKVNEEMLRFYWELGRDIVERNAENKYGSSFYTSLSTDLKSEIPSATGLSERNLRYIKRFYLLYNEFFVNLQQVAANFDTCPQFMKKYLEELFSIPWGHHMLLIDKCKGNPKKFLVELGTGFAYMGREYRLQIGELPPPSPPSTLFAAHHSAANAVSKRNLRRNSSIGTLAH